MVMTAVPEDVHAYDDLAWRNLAVDWHARQDDPGCSCDDQTPDDRFCAPSVEWADERFSEREDPELAGPHDRWNYETWTAAWGRNATLVVGDRDYQVPILSEPLHWLLTRILVRGRPAIEMLLYRDGPGDRMVTLKRARVCAEPSTVVARARAMIKDLMP